MTPSLVETFAEARNLVQRFQTQYAAVYTIDTLVEGPLRKIIDTVVFKGDTTFELSYNDLCVPSNPLSTMPLLCYTLSSDSDAQDVELVREAFPDLVFSTGPKWQNTLVVGLPVEKFPGLQVELLRDVVLDNRFGLDLTSATVQKTNFWARASVETLQLLRPDLPFSTFVQLVQAGLIAHQDNGVEPHWALPPVKHLALPLPVLMGDSGTGRAS